MARHRFQLVPFPSDAVPSPTVTIQGQLALEPQDQGGPGLELLIELSAAGVHPGLEALLIPEPQANPGGPRRDELWQHTCLECFVAPAGQPGYLEFNLAPDGAWNVYALEGYRRGAQPRRRLRRAALQLAVQRLSPAAQPALPAPGGLGHGHGLRLAGERRAGAARWPAQLLGAAPSHRRPRLPRQAAVDPGEPPLRRQRQPPLDLPHAAVAGALYDSCIEHMRGFEAATPLPLKLARLLRPFRNDRSAPAP